MPRLGRLRGWSTCGDDAAEGVARGGCSRCRPGWLPRARLPMPSARSSRVNSPGLEAAGWVSDSSRPCRAMRLASFQRLLELRHHGMARAVASGRRADPLPGPTCQLSSQQPTTPSQRWPLTCIPPAQNEPPWNPRAPLPSGLRAGTPDRRGKRGEVAAIFAIITTEPTWSIGELGLWTTSRISAPSRAHAWPSRSSSSSPGCPLGTSRTPPTLRSGTPNSATTGRGPRARAVATSNRSLPD